MNKVTFKDGRYVEFDGMTQAEAETYFKMYDEDKVPQGILYLKAYADNEEVNIFYKPKDVSFERIRRITGYLVGDVKRWNDGKQAELKDRVKHDSKIEVL